MAKTPGKTGFDKFLEETPRRAEFAITMGADSTTVVMADIDTGIDDGQAWLIYGLEYGFENIDPAVVLQSVGATEGAFQTQVHRNTDSALMLNANNDLVMSHHKLIYSLQTNGGTVYTEPLKIPINNVTLQPTLRVLFRTATDCPSISAATIQLAGALLYDVISAPARLSSKLGTLTDL